jgi:hypothetical protein
VHRVDGEAGKHLKPGTTTLALREQVERLGQALIALEQRMDELKEDFGLADEDLNLNLGPLGNLL